jgi:hypothetical protein
MDVLLCAILHRAINVAQSRARSRARKREHKTRVERGPLGVDSTSVFCSRFCVRNRAAAQLVLLFFSRDHARDRARKAKGPVGRRRDHGRRNASKKREWNRPLNGIIFLVLSTVLESYVNVFIKDHIARFVQFLNTEKRS